MAHPYELRAQIIRKAYVLFFYSNLRYHGNHSSWTPILIHAERSKWTWTGIISYIYKCVLQITPFWAVFTLNKPGLETCLQLNTEHGKLLLLQNIIISLFKYNKLQNAHIPRLTIWTTQWIQFLELEEKVCWKKCFCSNWERRHNKIHTSE